MNNHWQYGFPNSTARIDDEQAQQSSSYWSCPAWSANALYASIPRLGIGGTTLPANAPPSSSPSTVYPSSSATVHPSFSATTIPETQQQLPIGGLHHSAVFESAQPAGVKREVETDYNRRSSISLQVDELISALMPLPQSASSSGTEAGSDFFAAENFERAEVGCPFLWSNAWVSTFSLFACLLVYAQDLSDMGFYCIGYPQVSAPWFVGSQCDHLQSSHFLLRCPSCPVATPPKIPVQ